MGKDSCYWVKDYSFATAPQPPKKIPSLDKMPPNRFQINLKLKHVLKGQSYSVFRRISLWPQDQEDFVMYNRKEQTIKEKDK